MYKGKGGDISDDKFRDFDNGLVFINFNWG